MGVQRQEQASFDWKIQDGLTKEGAFQLPRKENWDSVSRTGIPDSEGRWANLP